MDDKDFYFYAVKDKLCMLEEFENILIDKTILSPDKSRCEFMKLYGGKTNEQYVSIYKYNVEKPKSGYKLYVQKNISFMIEPNSLNIIKPHNIEKAHDIILNKDNKSDLFSDIDDEYMVKNYIPMDDVYAISFPTNEYLKDYLNDFYLTNVSEEEQLIYIKNILKSIKRLLSKTGYKDLPIFDVDTFIDTESAAYDEYVKTLNKCK